MYHALGWMFKLNPLVAFVAQDYTLTHTNTDAHVCVHTHRYRELETETETHTQRDRDSETHGKITLWLRGLLSVISVADSVRV